MKQALATRRLFVILWTVIILTACMRVPVERSSDDAPTLLLYEAAIGDETAVLSLQTADGVVRPIAEGVRPGSHREWNGSILFLSEHMELFYAGPKQAPYRLLESVRPYDYGFLDNGRKLYAVTTKRELIFKAFGKEERVVGDQIAEVLPLEQRLLARRHDGSVLSIDFTGQSAVIAEGAWSLESAGDSVHAILRTSKGLQVTNGEQIIYTIDSETVGPINVTADGRAVLYLDPYDLEASAGTLKLLYGAELPPLTVAEQVTSYSMRTPQHIWYTTRAGLHIYHVEHQTHQRVTEAITEIVYAADHSTFGEAAAILMDGSLLVADETGAVRALVWDEQVVRVEIFGSGLICTLDNGTLYYVGPEHDETKEIGTFDEWLIGRQAIVGLRQSEVIAIDDQLQEKQLLRDIALYRYVYYGERLLSERMLQLIDIAGVWQAVEEDGKQIEIHATGKRRGAIVSSDGDIMPFLVRYASSDSLQLTMTGTAIPPHTLQLDEEGRLLLHDGKAHTVYTRSP